MKIEAFQFSSIEVLRSGRPSKEGWLILNNFKSLIVGVGVIFHPYCNSILMGYATGHCVNKSLRWGKLIF